MFMYFTSSGMETSDGNKTLMVSGQIVINTGCLHSVTLAYRGKSARKCGLEKDITCLNIALFLKVSTVKQLPLKSYKL